MSTLKFRLCGAPRGTAFGTAALLALTLASAGCSTTGTSDVDVSLYDHRLRHPIMISNEPEVLDIPVGMSGPAVSRQIDDAIANYVAGYSENGTGNITIQVPTASANEIAATSTGRAVHYSLVQAGVPHNRIEVAPYYVGNHAKAASVRLSYLRVKAVVPTCGIWPETAPNTRQNGQYHNFGCAAQQNLAAMVADPADLIAPQPTSPASGRRRAKVITDYGAGEETKSAVELIESDVGG
jgi:pilus assembly protein CpaD